MNINKKLENFNKIHKNSKHSLKTNLTFKLMKANYETTKSDITVIVILKIMLKVVMK